MFDVRTSLCEALFSMSGLHVAFNAVNSLFFVTLFDSTAIAHSVALFSSDASLCRVSGRMME